MWPVDDGFNWQLSRTLCPGKRLTDQDGVLVDEDENYDSADNPNGDHHPLKRN